MKDPEGYGGHRHEDPRVSLLSDVADAAQAVREAEESRREAQEALRAKVKAARDEGIPFAAIARAAELSAERIRQLYEEAS